MEEALESVLESGWISEVLGVLKSGKEATVYACRGGPRAGEAYVAAKVYRAREHRNFKNDSAYWDGFVITGSRARRAFNNKSRFGREVQSALWTGREFETLKELYAVGADVPRPIHSGDGVMLMELIGEGAEPAESLYQVKLAQPQARPLFQQAMNNIELWLSHNRIHGDLSPYNILYWRGRLVIIDFPQAVDARTCRDGHNLLHRDVERVCQYFAPYGIREDAYRRSATLWSRFLRAEL